MIEKTSFTVSDVSPFGDMWHFLLNAAADSSPVVFAFKSRKQANVCRRLMKEVIARAVAAPQPGEGGPPHVPISWGELIDKVTILEIKEDKIESENALRNIRQELSTLQGVARAVVAADDGMGELKSQLATINERLWRTEDAIRAKEVRLEFDPEFVELARLVYKLNDERSALKRAINIRLKSAIIEEKSYRAGPS
ncbi:MAG TPA: DUF6165 family protein [Rhizomicrobium sp.]|nr:DUF6165 family protein [Rhizomicrobium sp.]